MMTSWIRIHLETSFELVLSTGPTKPDAILIQMAITGGFISKTVQNPDPLHRGGLNQILYHPTSEICQGLNDQSVWISMSGVLVCVLIVRCWNSTANFKILTLIHDCYFLMYWAPLETKRRDICILPQPENDSKQMVNDDWSLKSGN